jgi:hypothetical protein
MDPLPETAPADVPPSCIPGVPSGGTAGTCSGFWPVSGRSSPDQMVTRRGRQCGVDAWPHRFRHHFSHTWLDWGGAEGDLMELNGQGRVAGRSADD